ncbi:MAG: hypothetical protein H0V89_07550 [Deltaproteobacteria bacterium]|nr:hypothetical protein [Deltaproteobacteria bacterium]
MGSIFEVIRQAYGERGFRDEWRNHHQGGPCSYGARDHVVRPGSPEIVAEVQAFAWNPTVPGAKSEDTVLCTEAGCENLTRSPSWPQNADGNDIWRR